MPSRFRISRAHRDLPLPLMLAALLAGCGGSGEAPATDSAAAPAVAPAASVDTNWIALFDGTSLTGWHTFKKEGQPVEGWSVQDSAIVRTGTGGDLVTDKAYGNFELELEWKVQKGGNSGIFFRIDPTADVTYLSAPEMQVLDDAAHKDGGDRLTSAGANYALHPAPAGAAKPAGEWNAVRLVAVGNHVEHWLNGQQIVSYELGSPDWEARRAASKFAKEAAYGRMTRGLIGLQDHGDTVWYRNLRIRERP